MKTLLSVLLFLLAAGAARSADWKWKWTSEPGKQAPVVEVCPLKYGKTWAYAVEIDDTPASTLLVSQPLLARYLWNDAPSGAGGGVDRPFVGTAAVTFDGVHTGNPTRLSLEQLEALKQAGWGVANHSYWHTGNHWDRNKLLQPEDFRRELYWSQTFFAALVGGGRAATHFVFPSGDFYYKPYLTDYGLRSASRVGGSSPRNLFDPKANPLDWTRNYLDEEPWARENDPLHGLPDRPQAGDFIIDFTHGMNGDPDHANHRRWVTRLDHIAGRWGARGDNSLWVAPTDEVFSYVSAAKAAKIAVTDGHLSVHLPDSSPGSALTLRIHGLSERSLSTVPEGTVIRRQGDTIWLTTPTIGKAGAPPPTPLLRRVYAGEAKDLTWDAPVAIAGVRFRQTGPVADGFALTLEVVEPDGTTASLLPPDGAKIAPAWGKWLLYPTIPDRPAPLAKALRISTDKNLKDMEVWAVER